MFIRVSATDLDAFRYFRQDEDSDLEVFLAQMRRQSAPTAAMRAGSAIHKALENAEYNQFSSLEADGYAFEIRADAVITLPQNDAYLNDHIPF